MNENIRNIEFLKMLEKIPTYRCFVFNQVVRYDSIEATATILDISVSKINNEMAALEKVLQDPLILHNRKRVVLTEIGKNFADFCRSLVDNYELMGNKFSDKSEDIVIGCRYEFSDWIFPEVIAEFSRHYPDVRIYIHSDSTYTNLTHNDLDVLISYPLSDLLNIKCEHLKDDPYYLYASPDYIKRYGDPITFEDFKKHKLLVFKNQNYYPKEIFGNNKPYLQTTSLGLAYEMAKLGQGIAVLPYSYLKESDLRNSNLVEVVKGMECYNNSISFMTRKFSSKKKYTDFLLKSFQEKI